MGSIPLVALALRQQQNETPDPLTRFIPSKIYRV